MVSAINTPMAQTAYSYQPQQYSLQPQQAPIQPIFGTPATIGQPLSPAATQQPQAAGGSGTSYSPLLAEANKATLQEIIAMNLAMLKNDALQGRPSDPYALESYSNAIGPGFSIVA